MSGLTRRRVLQLMGTTAALGAAGWPAIGRSNHVGRVVIIGGGFGGATAAKYLRLADPGVEVVLIEKDRDYISCALSNEVLEGERSLDSLTFDYSALINHHCVRFVHDEAVDIDATKHTVSTRGGQTLSYDRLIVSPGVGFDWDAIEGYDRAAAELIPHAWFAGPQTLLLKRQLRAMEDGGTVYIVAPPNPFKCPPGPYERAAQIANYFKHAKPRSKVVILDFKDAFAKQALFQQGWERFYPGMIAWVPGFEGGKVEEVDPASRTLYTELDEYQGDVINIIPPQQAGVIAQRNGLVDATGWCPVDPRTFESRLQPDVHVIGDACIAGAMPKSAYAANTQGKVCAAAISALLRGNPPPEPSYMSTCYSLITPEYGVSVAGVYRLVDGRIASVEGAGGTSPAQASDWVRRMEADYARSWFSNITSDIFL